MSKKPLIRLERIEKDWAVIMRSGRVEYRDNCYAKAVGVFDYLESRRRAQEAAQEGIRGGGPAPPMKPQPIND